MLELLPNAIAAFAVSLATVPLCRRLAVRFGFVAKPRDDRWHHRPTALLGGVGIVVAAMAVQIAMNGVRDVPVLLAGGALIFVVGLIDDLLSLKPSAKMVAQICIASGFVFFGYRLEWTPSLTLDTLLTLLWIVGLTNALNLLDNMDGLCAGIGLVAGVAVLTSLTWNAPSVSAEARYLSVVLGATAGFLVYNFHPASIFMGDSGSLFIGLNLAVLALAIPRGQHGPSNLLSVVGGPILILLIPIFDTTLVTVSRILSGRGASQGGRDHSSHRLVAIGLSERRAVAVLWSLAGLGGLFALLIARFSSGWSSLGAAVFVLGMIIFAVYLAHVRVYDTIDAALLKSGRVTPFAIHMVYRRRVAEVVLDACLVSIAYYAAYKLRFEGEAFSRYFTTFLASLPLMVGIQIIALYAVGAYRGVWRYFGLMDGVTFARGVFVGTLGGVCAIVYLYRFMDFSRSVFMIYAIVLLCLLVSSRASFRLISEFANRGRGSGGRLVVYGSGESATAALREYLNRDAACRMLGFVDDDPDMARRRIQGYPVLGDYASLVSLIANGAVDRVLVATNLIDVARLAALRDLCEDHRVALSRSHFELDEIVVNS